MRLSGIGYLVSSPSYRTTCLCQKKVPVYVIGLYLITQGASIGEQQLDFLAVSPFNIVEVELVHLHFGEV